MKTGDIIEWRGVNRVHRGMVIINSNNNINSPYDVVNLCRLDNGKVFPLNDLLKSKSAKIIEV